MSDADFYVRDHGSIVLFAPVTAAATAWIEEHVPEDAQWFGKALAVERRYAETLSTAMVEDGLQIRG